MGYVIDEILKLEKTQVGYAENPLGSNKTKYGVFSDTPISKNGPYPWYNGKKNGQCGWCAIGLNWEYMMVLKPLLGSYDKVRAYLNYPKPSNNAAAGCPEMYSYHKKWQVAKNKGVPGDEIFLNTKLGKCGHVGRIVGVSNGKYTTIEYNKGDRVAYGSYSINSSDIYAVIHIDFSDIEPKPEPEPTPHPAPEPPTPVADNLYKVVNIKSYLAIRTEPSANGIVAGKLFNDAIVSVNKINGDWANITGDLWVYMGYLEKV